MLVVVVVVGLAKWQAAMAAVKAYAAALSLAASLLLVLLVLTNIRKPSLESRMGAVLLQRPQNALVIPSFRISADFACTHGKEVGIIHDFDDRKKLRMR